MAPELEMIRIRPQPRSRIPGKNALAISIWLTTIGRNCFSIILRSASAMAPGGGPPPLFITISIPLKSFSTYTINLATAVASERSTSYPRAMRPVRLSKSLACVLIALPLRPQSTTCAPSAASCSAMPWPRPREAPNTKARLFNSPKSTIKFL